MGRKKTIDTDELISLIDEFYTMRCNRDASLLKLPAIGEYIRAKGYPVQDYILRRNELARDYIDQLRTTTEEAHIRSVSVFRDIDTDSFLQKNNTMSKLKRALIERESYYKEITNSAAFGFKENKQLKAEIIELKNTIFKLQSELSEETENRKIMKANNQSLNKEIKILRDIIDTYVYPEIANELLKKSGLINETAGIVDDSIVNKKIVSSNTNVANIKNTVVKGLFDRL